MCHSWFNLMSQSMKETSSLDNKMPVDYCRAKKLVKGLGLTSQKIDCCVNGCRLYYMVDKNMKDVSFVKNIVIQDVWAER